MSRRKSRRAPRPERGRRAPARLLDGIDLVIFDKDGTLIDFDAMWAPWVLGLAARLDAATGRPVAAALFPALGFNAAAGRTLPGQPLAVTPMAGIRALVTEVVVVAGIPRPAAERAVDDAWEVPDPVAAARPITDIRRLFASLRLGGRRIAVATSDDRAPTEKTMAGLGVADLVDAYACADDGLPVKPAPEMVVEVCRALGVDVGRAAVVGDSVADLAMGRAAGAALVIGVLSGVSGRADLEPLADAILPSVGYLVDAPPRGRDVSSGYP